MESKTNIFIFSDSVLLADILGQHLKYYNVIHLLPQETEQAKKLENIDDIYIFDNCPVEKNFFGKIILISDDLEEENKNTAYISHYVKPLKLQKLLEEINHWEKINEKIFLGNDIYLYKFLNKIIIANNVINLTDKEKELILYISENNEDGVSKSDIMQEIWHYSMDVETSTLNTHLYQLRKKLAVSLIVIKNGKYFIENSK